VKKRLLAHNFVGPQAALLVATPMLGTGEAVSRENNAGDDAIQSQCVRMFYKADLLP